MIILYLFISDCLNAPSWTIDDYVNIHTPLSPCVSLQWTLRDNQVVNLPVPLLVAGDVILLRPGHIVPGSCRQLEVKYSYIAVILFCHLFNCLKGKELCILYFYITYIVNYKH